MNPQTRLTVVEVLPSNPRGEAMWKCQCKCGNVKVIRAKSVRSGATKSCGCLARELARQRATGNTYRNERDFQWLYSNLLRSAKSGKRTCNISYEDFLKFTAIKTCHYCGTSIPWEPHGKYRKSSSGYFLDRKDNSKGYSTNNCVVCCSLCNHVKGNLFTYSEMIRMGDTIRAVRSLRAEQK